MVTVEQFSRIVTAVHDAAVEPDRWVDALSLVRTTMGATGTGLIRGGASSRDVESCSVPDEEAMSAYQDYYRLLDYVLAAVDDSVVGQVRSGTSLVALNPRSEFNVDWMRRYAMDDGIFVRLSEGARPCCFLIASPRRDESFASADNVRIANSLVPHLQQALRMQRTLTELRDSTRRTTHPVDTISAPAAVLGPDMALSCHNNAFGALIRYGATFSVHQDRVILNAPRSDVEFRRAVAAATGTSGAGTRIGDSLQVPRSDRRPLIVHVSPLWDHDQPSALVVAVDPDVSREPPKQLLRRLFSLTNAESEVALRISRGQSLAGIADELSLTVATIKTHLQHVYDKTDTHRQADLVRLLLALTP